MPPTKLLEQPRPVDVQASIEACLANGDRLLDDALQLEFHEPASTRLVISMLAQEEYAKAFLLYLVRETMIPWDADLMRVINNHACKHLVAIVLEYLEPEWDTVEELREILRAEFDLDGRFPLRVSSALNILYFEKIRRGDFFDDNEYEQEVVAIATGERDKVKQDALYVRLDRSCRVQSAPAKVTKEDADLENKKADRYGSIVRRIVLDGSSFSEQFRKLKEVTTLVFWQKYKPIGSKTES